MKVRKGEVFSVIDEHGNVDYICLCLEDIYLHKDQNNTFSAGQEIFVLGGRYSTMEKVYVDYADNVEIWD